MKRESMRVRLNEGVDVAVEYAVFGEHGSGHPVGAVFANGWGCTPEMTETPAATLGEKGYKVVTFHPDTTACITVHDRVKIMMAVATEVFGAAAYAAIGFSLGGDVATNCADQDKRVVGLVDAAGNHELSDRFLTGIAARMDEDYFVDGGGLNEFLDEISGSKRQSVRDYAKHVAGMSKAELRAYHFAARSSWEDGEAGGSLSKLTGYTGGPAFYVHGDGEIADYLPKIQGSSVTELVIPDSGHFMYADQPEKYAGALEAALKAINKA